MVLPVTLAHIAVHVGPGDRQLAPYFSQLFPALPRLQTLGLGWEKGVEVLPQLPSLSGLPSLACVKICWMRWTAFLLNAASVQLPLQLLELLQALQTAPQLRQLEIEAQGAVRKAGEARDQLVLALQEALRSLRVIKLSFDRPSGVSWDMPLPVQLGAATQAALRPGLVVADVW